MLLNTTGWTWLVAQALPWWGTWLVRYQYSYKPSPSRTVRCGPRLRLGHLTARVPTPIRVVASSSVTPSSRREAR